MSKANCADFTDRLEGIVLQPPSPEDIKVLRKSTGMNQNQIAKLLGLSSGVIFSKYETGARKPSPALWTLMLLVTDMHPTVRINTRSKL